MGLYINRIDHPKVFKNEESIREPNQSYFKRDYLSEWVQKQDEMSHKLLQAINGLQANYQQQVRTQKNRWEEADNRLQKLNDRYFRQEKLTGDALASQNRLENSVTKLHDKLEKEDELNQKTLDKIDTLQASNQTVTDKLAAQEAIQQQLIMQMDDTHNLQKQMSEQTARQEARQADMSERLENQEAMMKKVIRQLDNLRSIIYERTHHVVETIENSYDLTSTFFYNMLTGSKQPMTLLIMNEKNEESMQKSKK